MQKRVVCLALLVLAVFLVLAACKKTPTGDFAHEGADRDYALCVVECETSPDVSDGKMCKTVCLDQLAERMRQKMG